MQGTAAVALDWLKRWESLAARDARADARLATLEEVRATAAIAQQTALSLKRDVERACVEKSVTEKSG